MNNVRPKKKLGQHFLKDESIAQNIVKALKKHNNYNKVIEIGPGTGVLTKYLIKTDLDLTIIELDSESIAYLKENSGLPEEKIINEDFLQINLKELFNEPYAIIGNFPYNISSQIFFKVLEHKNEVQEVVCMIQKEVAERLASPPGNKTYGILSVLLQAFYQIEYLFTVKPHVFYPAPKVDSAVIRITRNETKELRCDEKMFFRIVKQGFNNRRKTLRNALKPLHLPLEMNHLE
ncbi:MAG: 16S rRNA (adenine(1518)-N(6)/adenine(1519)-N(6))-dimethyltransferase RsmA, partial [Bacteroidota bacterium]|nr:16S rRNA (adenine(1518)-N(6)/adenine(1519)-N(6))-dimethyltransferase RsmA [Bacteroidota bacterium]